MQCVNCRFENMPGLDQCGRCGTSLRLATAVIDVNPPRASQRSLARSFENSFAGLRRYLRELSQRRLVRPLGGDGVVLTGSPGDVAIRLIVPGWPQLFLGQTFRGRLLLGTWLVFLSLAILYWGTFGGSIALGLVFAVHLSSVIDIVFTGTSDRLSRLFCSVFYGSLIIGVVYFPAIFVLRHVAVAQQMNWAAGGWERDDVVLYNVWASPKPGAIVIYEMSTATLQSNARGEPQARIAGRQVDRILAGPGQTVTVKQGEMLVDGVPAKWHPMAEDMHLADGQITVPDDHYLITPSSNPMLVRVPASLWTAHRLGLIPRNRIVGTVYLRTYPLSRFGRVR